MAEVSAGLIKIPQTVNTGTVAIPFNTATKLLSANPNRKSVQLTSNVNNVYFGTSSSVNATTGFNPFVGSFNSQAIVELRWQTEIWVYGASPTISFSEESIS